jgi:predicted HAD superfamily Cof-like phosphohydrolase
MTEATKKETPYNIAHLRRMIFDELEEFEEATKPHEKVDALLDLLYYLANAVARGGPEELLERAVTNVNGWVDVEPLFEIVHTANMSKFTLPGGHMKGDKWMKPPNFIPPDAEIARYLESNPLDMDSVSRAVDFFRSI